MIVIMLAATMMLAMLIATALAIYNESRDAQAEVLQRTPQFGPFPIRRR